MGELGYVEGHDYGFEVRYADGNVSRIPPQMEELVRLKPDIVLSGTTAGVIAARKLTDTIPIVCGDLTNPVEFGVAASYARPGGNVTGVLLTVEDLPTKLLALALEVVPGATKIGLLVHSDNPIQPALQRTLEPAVNALGVELTVLEIVSRDDLHAAFQRLAREHAKVVLMLPAFMFLNERKRIALFAMAERLPTMSGFRDADRISDEIRAGDQPDDRQGARIDHSADLTCPRGRGDRIGYDFAAVHESAFGT